MQFKLLNVHSGPDLDYTNDKIAAFLHDHLEEYGDPKEDILKCLDYVFNPNRGGHVLLGLIDGELVGVVIMNATGMDGYIPEYILVYIAFHRDYRGKGFGKKLMQHAIKLTNGNIALHVEPDNPAKHLYEKLGFTNKYLEMRLTK